MIKKLMRAVVKKFVEKTPMNEIRSVAVHADQRINDLIAMQNG